MEEITIRPARIDDCPELGRIIVSATQDAFRDRVPDQCLNWLTPEESAMNWARNRSLIYWYEYFLTIRTLLFTNGQEQSNLVGGRMNGTVMRPRRYYLVGKISAS